MKQHGFSTAGGLMVVVSLALIVFAGYVASKANSELQPEPAAAVITKKDTANKEFLEFKGAGLKLKLNDLTKDAYVGRPSDSTEEIYVSSHYFDGKAGFEGCTVGKEGSGIVALSSAKPGDDNGGIPWTAKDLQIIGGSKVDDRYYWLTPGNGKCWNAGEIGDDDPDVIKLREFRDAILAQQSTITKL